MQKTIKILIVLLLMASNRAAYGNDRPVINCSERITAKISKSGINRITNYPYQIVQVTGDETRYKIKYDQDGSNIYIIPVAGIGEKIEINIKNNLGTSYDIDLEVSAVKGQTINIASKISNTVDKERNKEISEMLSHMKQGKRGKYYVSKLKSQKIFTKELTAEQIYMYKWKDLVGLVFEVKNRNKHSCNIRGKEIADNFSNVLVYWPGEKQLPRGRKSKIFIVQEILGR